MCIRIKIKKDLYKNKAKSIQYHFKITVHKW